MLCTHSVLTLEKLITLSLYISDYFHDTLHRHHTTLRDKPCTYLKKRNATTPNQVEKLILTRNLYLIDSFEVTRRPNQGGIKVQVDIFGLWGTPQSHACGLHGCTCVRVRTPCRRHATLLPPFSPKSPQYGQAPYADHGPELDNVVIGN